MRAKTVSSTLVTKRYTTKIRIYRGSLNSIVSEAITDNSISCTSFDILVITSPFLASVKKESGRRREEEKGRRGEVEKWRKGEREEGRKGDAVPQSGKG